ncbi:MAG: serine/threonine protein kinase [Lentisphaeraceae bacterium]|nr:serine/threonine protein kinase [Lentisphaeraceae bacterium]
MNISDSGHIKGLGKIITEEASGHNDEYSKVLDAVDQDKRYSDKTLINSGGMKHIYRVKDTVTGRMVVMAELQKPDDVKDRLKFFREARMTALLEHPNIVPVYEVGHENGFPYFTMKEIHGKTLGEILKRIKLDDQEYLKKYDLKALLEIFIKVCDAVSYAHSKGVIHLDLKPDNIHVGEFGEVLVIDWGLARKIEERDEEEGDASDITNSENTINGIVKGTIGYMAPEQACGQNDLREKRTDIYALGAILFTLLSRKVPVEDKDAHQALAKIVKGEVSALDSSVPQALRAVIEKAMATNIDHRYENVEELQSEISRYISGYATLAQDASAGELIKLFVRRNKSLCLFLVLIFLIFSASAALLLKQQDEKAAVEKEAALSAKEREKKALKLYRSLDPSNQNQHTLLDNSLIQALQAQNILSNQLKFEEAYRTMSSVDEKEKSSPLFWLTMGKLEIGHKNFKEALKCYEKSLAATENDLLKEEIVYVIDLLKNLSDEPDYDEFLKFAAALNKVEYDDVQASMFSIYNREKRLSSEQLEQALKALNPGANKMVFSLKEEEGQKKIYIKGNRNFRNISPLAYFDVQSLVIENIYSVEKLNFLYSPELKELMVINSSPANFGFINFFNLESLVLRKVKINELKLCSSLQKLRLNEVKLNTSLDFSSHNNFSEVVLKKVNQVSAKVRIQLPKGSFDLMADSEAQLHID